MKNGKPEHGDYTRQVLADIKTMDADELLQIHGISINESNAVYDQAYDKTFKDINEWIYFSSGDEDNKFEKFGLSDGYDDEYY